MPMILRRRVSALNLSLAVTLAVLLAGGALLLLADDSGGTTGTAAATTTSAAVTDVSATLTASGTATYARSKDASFSAEGEVESIAVSVGDSVEKGDVLATASSESAQAQVTSAEAQYDSAYAAYVKTKADTADLEDTADRDAQRASAWAQVVSAESALDEAQESLDALTLTAPTSGTVVAVNGSVGASTTATSSSSTSADTTSSSAFVTIASTGRFVVSGSFSESDVMQLEEGQDATIVFNALPDDEFAATVSSIELSPTTTDGVTSYGVSFALDEQPTGLRDGASAAISVTTASASGVLAVPSSAVTTVNGTSTVQLVGADGTTSSQEVTLGVEGDTYTEITAGLSEGDTVELGAVSTSASGQSGMGGMGGGMGQLPGGGAPGGTTGSGFPGGTGGRS